MRAPSGSYGPEEEGVTARPVSLFVCIALEADADYRHGNETESRSQVSRVWEGDGDGAAQPKVLQSRVRHETAHGETEPEARHRSRLVDATDEGRVGEMSDPICEQAIASDAAPGHLTGFTRRIASSLAHLSDAWCVADASNTPGVLAAIRSLFLTRSVMANREAFEHFLIWDLDDDTARRLLFEVYDGLPDNPHAPAQRFVPRCERTRRGSSGASQQCSLWRDHLDDCEFDVG